MNKGKPIQRWQDLLTLYASLSAQRDRQWLFRGQRCGCDLASSLERAVVQRYKQPHDRMPHWERWLLSEFKRHAHRYLEDLPSDADTLRWYSLMQHHGAPTRLLDFTYSVYVAVYFAVESANPGDHCALWAVDANWCWTRAKEKLGSSLRKRIESDETRGKTPALQAELLARQIPRVVPDNSFFLDERLAIQQGVFLVPLDMTKPFMDNLVSDRREAKNHVRRYEIYCSPNFMREALLHLRRMNITSRSLFPGLDGFARDLQTRISITDLSRVIGVAERGLY